MTKNDHEPVGYSIHVFVPLLRSVLASIGPSVGNGFVKIAKTCLFLLNKMMSWRIHRLQIGMLNFEDILSLNCSHEWHETLFLWKGICCSFIIQSVIIPSQVVWLLLDLKKHLNFVEKHSIRLHWSRPLFFYPMSFPNDLS